MAIPAPSTGWWVGQRPAGLPRDPGAVEWTYIHAGGAPSDWSDVHGPYSTEPAALAELFILTAGAAGSPTGTGTNPNTGLLAGNTNISQQTQNLTGPVHLPTGLAAIGDFFSRLTEASTWERVGLAVVGVMLVGIGIVSVASGSKTGQAVKKSAVKASAFL